MDKASPTDRLPVVGQIALLLGQVALAGCVDAIGWLLLGGLFVSFMSGNSTQLAVALADGKWLLAGRSAAVLASFFMGVFIGALWRELSRHSAQVGLFALVALALGLSFLLVWFDGLEALHLLPLAFAMGLLNNARRQVAGAPVGGTFVTGAFVAAAQGLAQWLLGRATPAAFAPYALSWLALVAGALIGAVLVLRLGNAMALLAPVGWATALALAHWLAAQRGAA
ncbi:YoaK family protein [Camelimonas sp. ID_303_24]